MKLFRMFVILAVLGALAPAQTIDYGVGIFANEEGPILLAVDAQAAMQRPESPYVPFILYLGAKDMESSYVVSRNDVTLVYQGKEYKMPGLEEFRKNYGGEVRDVAYYRHLSQAGLVSSWVRFYKFQSGADFFPPLRLTAYLPVNEATMTGSLGFVTRSYFKNPGFKKGDKLIIRVNAKDHPENAVEVQVELK